MKYEIEIETTETDETPFVSFAINGKRRDVPTDRPVIVEASIVEVLRNATFNKVIKDFDENDGTTKQQTIKRSRFPWKIIREIPEPGDGQSIPVGATTQPTPEKRAGRPKGTRPDVSTV